MIQLNNLRDWKSLSEGEVLELKKNRRRAVKLHVSAPDQTRLFYQAPGDKPSFLATFIGLDVVCFVADGEIDIIADGPIQFRTADNERALAKPDGEKFVRMMERAPRNPEMEAIQRAVYQNVERRLAAQAAEFNRTLEMRARVDAARIANLEEELRNESSDDDEPESASGDDSEEPESGSDAGNTPEPEPDTAKAPAKRGTRRRKGGGGADAKS